MKSLKSLKFLFLSIVLLFPLSLLAQFTTVTAQVKDPGNLVYQSCHYNIDFVNNTGIPQLPLLSGAPFQTTFGEASCDSTGHLSIRLADSGQITPPGTQWHFSICTADRSQCFGYTSPACPAVGCITGTTIDISSALQAVAAALNQAVPTNAAQTFTFVQALPGATTWTVNHNFGVPDVAVTVYDQNGNLVVPDSVQAINSNTTVITFLQAQAGRAYIINAAHYTPTAANPNFLVANPTGSQAVLGDFPFVLGGSLGAKRIAGIRTVPDGFATFSSAITDIGSAAGSILGKCGTVNDNISITSAPEDVSGASSVNGCVTLQPLTPATDLFTIDATATGNTGTTTLRNVTPNCPSGACGNIVTITGSQSTNQPNDYLQFRNIFTPQTVNSVGTSGFANGIKITGRTIWSIWDNLRMNGTRGDGWNATSTGGLVGPVNAAYINNSQFYGNYGYGVRLNTSGSVTLSEANVFTNTNVESNGNNTALSPCAGILINGVYITSFVNNNFEHNCPGSSDTNSAEVRITGSNAVPQFVNFLNNDWNVSAAHYGLFADATRSGGVITGNRFVGSPTAAVHIAATTMDSLWEIGVNQGIGKPDVVADASGNTHVTAPAFGVLGAYTLIGPGTGCPSSGGTFDLVNTCTTGFPLNNLALNGTSATWSNFTNGMGGQLLIIQALTNNGYTLTNSAGGAGQMVMRDAANFVLAQNDAILFRLDSSGNWQEMFRNVINRANTFSQLQILSGGAKLGASGSVLSDSRDLIQSAHSCGTTTTCANTANGSNRMIFGSVALASGTPSTATIIGISPAFTSSSTYFCTLGNATTQANPVKVANVSGSSFTITGPNTVTDTVNYQCIGN